MPRPKKGHRKDGRVQIKRVIDHDIDGQPINKWFSGKNKAEAEANYQEFLHEWEKKQEEKKHTPFEKWVDTWLYTYKEPDIKETTFLSTYKRPCKNHILPYFKSRYIQDISQSELKAFVNSLSSFSQSYINKVVLCLSGIFESAIDNDLLFKNPCRNLTGKSKQIKQKKRTYDKETVDILCRSNHKYALMVHILLKMGLRASELCGLRWEDIDLKNGTMHIRQALTTEGSKEYIGAPKTANSIRKLPISNDLLKRLKEVEKNGVYVALIDNKNITPNRLSKRLDSFYNYMGVDKEYRLSPHELRHTCGTLIYNDTKDIYHTSRYLGHSDISITTKIYVHSHMQDEEIHIEFPKNIEDLLLHN